MESIQIKTEYIKLDQLLKYSAITENGSDAKYLITNGYVYLNGTKELRRGKKIYSGDIVKVIYEGESFEVKVCK